jgi:hypothetical protein
MSDPSLPLPHAYFRPRGLDNLALADELESLDPILDAKVMNVLPNSDTPQIFTACGRGARSTFRTLRHGLEVEESVSSDLPGIPNAVWTTKRREDGKISSSFESSTLLKEPLQTNTTRISSFRSSTEHLFCLLEKSSKKFRIQVFCLLHQR